MDEEYGPRTKLEYLEEHSGIARGLYSTLKDICKRNKVEQTLGGVNHLIQRRRISEKIARAMISPKIIHLIFPEIIESLRYYYENLIDAKQSKELVEEIEAMKYASQRTSPVSLVNSQT